MKRILIGLAMLFLSACASATPSAMPTPAPSASTSGPTAVPGVYKPLQNGDVVENAKIDYAYILPSADRPAITIAAAQHLLQLVSIKPQLTDGLLSYAKEISQSPHTIYAYDENNPNQTEPKLMTIEANKPIEYVVIRVEEGPKYWSVTERQEGEIRAAYKLVRRHDGGLTFVDAYDLTALNTFSTLLTTGGGAGMVFSARLALLKTIVNDQGYQRGDDVMAARVPDAKMYDPRVLQVDPNKEGLAMNVDWAIQSRPGPNPGMQVQ